MTRQPHACMEIQQNMNKNRGNQHIPCTCAMPICGLLLLLLASPSLLP
jgi:hypothetical protein